MRDKKTEPQLNLEDKRILDWVSYATYVDVERKIFYIETPKVACSSVKHFFREFYGLPPVAMRPGFRVSRLENLIHLRDESPMKTLTMLSAREQNDALTGDGWFRFCATRHPFDRFFSAWRDKIFLCEPGSASARFVPSDGRKYVEFEEFYARVMAEDDPFCCDIHWQSQASLLMPNDIRYSHIYDISQLGHLADDLAHHLRVLGFGERIPQLKSYNSSLSASSKGFVTPRVAAGLASFYEADFARFSFPDFDVENVPSVSASSLTSAQTDFIFDRNRVIDESALAYASERAAWMARLEKITAERDDILVTSRNVAVSERLEAERHDEGFCNRMISDLPSVLEASTVESLSSPKIDVSIVLNAHREAAFLPRTLDSLDEAVRYAQAYGITCELVVIEDRSDEATREIFRHRDYSPYIAHKIIEVDNGSLGLSRNDGIAASGGEFIMTADADDLVSLNIIVENCHAAGGRKDRALFFPQYYLAFGAEPHLYEMHGLDVTTPLALVGSHPFVSRFFARRAHLAGLNFLDHRLSNGFAYEDWHFNLQAVGAGIDLRVVPDTIVFYRKRQGSLLRLADDLSNGVPAYAPLFDPPTFLHRCSPWRTAAAETPPAHLIDGPAIRERFLENPVCRELTKAAAELEPAIDPLGAPAIHAFSNVGCDRQVGVAYEAICQLVAGDTFEEILLVPFLSSGGGEKYVLHVVMTLLEQNQNARLLIISGEPFASHAWLDRLPPSVIFLDLYAIGAHLDARQRQHLTLRIIQSCGRGARIHVKSCPFALEFLRRFAPVLNEHEIIFYRFCDGYGLFYGSWVRSGLEFDFLSDCGQYFHKIVTDNDCIKRADVRRLPHLADKFERLYNYVEDEIVTSTADARGVQRRVLWASRLDAQKRPKLLPLIASELERRAPDVVIDVWGSSVFKSFDVAQLAGHGNLNYCGPFERFSALCPDRYDLFIYTSAFDGLPNVLLEAMAAGLGVIAANVGGVHEAVTSGAGILIDSAPLDEDTARAYADAIAQCYEEPDRIGKLRAGARAVIAARHGKDHFAAEVRRLFRSEAETAIPEVGVGALLPG
jgi:glycosyltransferase involved in cell wall biosynthesis